MKIKLGTNRITIVCKNYVYKIGIGKRGFAANLQEYILSLNNSLVAKTELHKYGLKQERLTNIVVYPRYAKIDEILEEHKHLFNCKLHNKLQVGKDKNNQWKIFDYEDIKYYTRHESEGD